jgi:hypothetical protein
MIKYSLLILRSIDTTKPLHINCHLATIKWTNCSKKLSSIIFKCWELEITMWHNTWNRLLHNSVNMILVFIWLPHIEAQVALQINLNYKSTKPKSSEFVNHGSKPKHFELLCQKNENTLHQETLKKILWV